MVANWVIKRVLKFALKRALKHFLKTEVDIQALDVQLSAGTVELKDLLLDVDYLNAEYLTHSPVELMSGLIGKITITLGLQPVIKIEDVLLVAKSRVPLVSAVHPDSPVTPCKEKCVKEDEDSQIQQGIHLIAAGLEYVLSQLQVIVARPVMRLEVPAENGVHALVLHADQLIYNAKQEEALSLESCRIVEFSGLIMAVHPVGGAMEVVLCGIDEAGVDGSLQLQYIDDFKQQPLLQATLELKPVHAQVSPEQAVVAVDALHAVTASHGVPANVDDSKHAPFREALWGTQSVLEGLLLPDCEPLVLNVLKAEDMVSLMEESFHSFMEEEDVPLLLKQHDLRESIRSTIEAHTSMCRWTVSMSTSTLTASILYPEDIKPRCHFRPRLTLDASQLNLLVVHGLDSSVEVSLSSAIVEIAEQLPYPRCDVIGGCPPSGVSLEAAATIPSKLPESLIGTKRPLPTSAGDYPLPHNAAFQDTLKQLSQLTQETFFSAMDRISSTRKHGLTSTQFDLTNSRVQILPMLNCGTGCGSALLAHFTINERADLLLAIQPVSVWVSLSSLLRLIAAIDSFYQNIPELPSESARGKGVRELEISMFAPHICVLMAVPPRSETAQLGEHLTVDMYSAADTVLAALKNSKQTRYIKDELGVLLDENTVPTVHITVRKSEEGLGSGEFLRLSCQVALAGLQFHIVPLENAQIFNFARVYPLDTEVISIEITLSGTEGQAFFADGKWDELIAHCAHFGGAGYEAGTALASRLRKECIELAPLSVRFKGRVQSELSIEIVTAVGDILEGLALVFKPANDVDLVTATPSILALKCEVDCLLHDAQTFQLSAQSADFFIASSLDGLIGASMFDVVTHGLKLCIHEKNMGCVLYQPCEAIDESNLHILSISRPLSGVSAEFGPKKVLIPTEALTFVACESVAIAALDSANPFAWAKDFARVFLSGEAAPSRCKRSTSISLGRIALQLPSAVVKSCGGQVLLALPRDPVRFRITGMELFVGTRDLELHECLAHTLPEMWFVASERELLIDFDSSWSPKLSNRLLKVMLNLTSVCVLRDFLQGLSLPGGHARPGEDEKRTESVGVLDQLKDKAFPDESGGWEQSVFVSGGYYTEMSDDPHDSTIDGDGAWTANERVVDFNYLMPFSNVGIEPVALLNNLSIVVEFDEFEMNISRLTLQRIGSDFMLWSVGDVEVRTGTRRCLGFYDGLRDINTPMLIFEVHSVPTIINEDQQHEWRVVVKMLPIAIKVDSQLVGAVQRYKQALSSGGDAQRKGGVFIQRLDMDPSLLHCTWGGSNISFALNLCAQKVLGLPLENVFERLAMAWFRDIREHQLGKVASDAVESQRKRAAQALLAALHSLVE